MDAAPARDASSPESERYRTLLEINNAVISSLTRGDLFRAIARSLRRIVSFERAMARKRDRKSTRLNSSHRCISYAVFCLKKKKHNDSDNSKKRRTQARS